MSHPHNKPGPSGGSQPSPEALQANFKAKQRQYAPAMTFNRVTPEGNAPGEVYQPLPAIYGRPSDAADRFQTKLEMMRNPELNQTGGTNANINYTFDNADVAQVTSMENARKQYEYHAYLDKMIDPRKPGNLDWAMSMEPDWIKMKISALDENLKLQEQITRLKAFGVQSTEDLRLKYLLDTKQLQDDREATDQNRYIKGWFAPKYNAPDTSENRSTFSEFTSMLNSTSTPGGQRTNGGYGAFVDGGGAAVDPSAYAPWNLNPLNDHSTRVPNLDAWQQPS